MYANNTEIPKWYELGPMKYREKVAPGGSLNL